MWRGGARASLLQGGWCEDRPGATIIGRAHMVHHAVEAIARTLDEKRVNRFLRQQRQLVLESHEVASVVIGEWDAVNTDDTVAHKELLVRLGSASWCQLQHRWRG